MRAGVLAVFLVLSAAAHAEEPDKPSESTEAVPKTPTKEEILKSIEANLESVLFAFEHEENPKTRRVWLDLYAEATAAYVVFLDREMGVHSLSALFSSLRNRRSEDTKFFCDQPEGKATGVCR